MSEQVLNIFRIFRISCGSFGVGVRVFLRKRFTILCRIITARIGRFHQCRVNKENVREKWVRIRRRGVVQIAFDTQLRHVELLITNQRSMHRKRISDQT